MTGKELDRIRFVTGHFNELKNGLSFVTSGVLFAGPNAALLFHVRPPWLLFLLCALCWSIGMMQPLVPRYYRKNFGEVEPLPVTPPSLSIYSVAGDAVVLEGADLRRSRNREQWRILSRVAGFALVLSLVLRALDTTSVRVTPSEPTWALVMIQLLYLVWGSLFLGTWLLRERRLSQAYYLVLGLLMLGLFAIGSVEGPVLLLLSNLWVTRLTLFVMGSLHDFRMTYVIYGTSSVLAGLLDHWQLVRALGRPAMEKEA